MSHLDYYRIGRIFPRTRLRAYLDRKQRRWKITLYPVGGGQTVTLSGTINGTSALSGSFVETLALAGTINGVSTLAGSFIETLALNGTIAAASTLTGNTVLTLVLNATINGVSTVNADMRLTLALQGTVAAVSTINGDLTIQGQVALAGTIAGSSALTADMRLTLALNGTIAAISSLSQAMLSIAIPLNATIAATSSATSDITLTRGLNGTIAAVSTLAGNFIQSLTLAATITAALQASCLLTVTPLTSPGIKIPGPLRQRLHNIKGREATTGGTRQSTDNSNQRQKESAEKLAVSSEHALQ